MRWADLGRVDGEEGEGPLLAQEPQPGAIAQPGVVVAGGAPGPLAGDVVYIEQQIMGTAIGQVAGQVIRRQVEEFHRLPLAVLLQGQRLAKGQQAGVWVCLRIYPGDEGQVGLLALDEAAAEGPAAVGHPQQAEGDDPGRGQGQGAPPAGQPAGQAGTAHGGDDGHGGQVGQGEAEVLPGGPHQEEQHDAGPGQDEPDDGRCAPADELHQAGQQQQGQQGGEVVAVGNGGGVVEAVGPAVLQQAVGGDEAAAQGVERVPAVDLEVDDVGAARPGRVQHKAKDGGQDGQQGQQGAQRRAQGVAERLPPGALPQQPQGINCGRDGDQGVGPAGENGVGKRAGGQP